MKKLKDLSLADLIALKAELFYDYNKAIQDQTYKGIVGNARWLVHEEIKKRVEEIDDLRLK